MVKKYLTTATLIPLILITLWTSGYGQQDTSRLTLIFAGDIMGHDTQISAAKNESGYSYDTCFSQIRPYIEKADLAIANLEVTLAGPPYKGYPQFSSPDQLAVAAKNAGFDILLTANNHSLDRQQQGLERTIDILDQENIIHTGTYKTPEERHLYNPLILQKNNIRIAILNYTYGTNGIKVRKPNIVNYIQDDILLQDLEKAKSAEPDFILVTIHWGIEYQREENKEQQRLATLLVENGVDAIIGSHPHVVQPIRLYSSRKKEVPVCFSLGNFVSNQRKRYTDGGILFQFTLEKTRHTQIREYKYIPTWVYKPAGKNGQKDFVIIPSHREKAYYDLFNMPSADYQTMKTFFKDTYHHLEGISLYK